MDRFKPSPAEALRWIAFLAISWLILRPSLQVTISLDDFVNPFYVFDCCGPSPIGVVGDVSRDVHRNGHFNYIGQNAGAMVFVIWTYLLSWGVRYSLIYATTKFVIFIFTALVVARVLRSLTSLAGRPMTIWHSRALVALVLFSTLQLHVAWGFDPVGSFPLFGYLAAAIGMVALDLAIHAVVAGGRRSLIVAAAGLCVSVQYYELNVVMIGALLPVALAVRRMQPKVAWRTFVARVSIIIGPCLVMVAVLRTISAAANRGYTGTDVELGDGTVTVFFRALAGSLPGSAWPVARDWLAQPVALFATTAFTFLVVATVMVGWPRLVATTASAAARGDGDRSASPGWFSLALLVACPMIVWVGATVVQASTAKILAETPRVGYVYMYYAYGSIGVVLIGLLVVSVARHYLDRLHHRRWGDALMRLRPVLLALALTFVLVQTAINDNVHRVFDQRLAVNSAVLVAYSDQAAERERCAALEAWNAQPHLPAYYRHRFIQGINNSYQYFHGEPFCTSIPVPPLA